MSRSLQLRIRVIERVASPRVAVEGEFVADLVKSALGRSTEAMNHAVPVAVVVRAQRTELLDLRAPRAAGVPMSRFLAGLSRSGSGLEEMPVAVGVAGRFQLQVPATDPGSAGSVPVGLAFLEWSDCRWWQWRTLLGSDGQPIEGSDLRRSAEAGDPVPAGLGRWWSLGRRTGIRVDVGTSQRGTTQPAESSLIH